MNLYNWLPCFVIFTFFFGRIPNQMINPTTRQDRKGKLDETRKLLVLNLSTWWRFDWQHLASCTRRFIIRSSISSSGTSICKTKSTASNGRSLACHQQRQIKFDLNKYGNSTNSVSSQPVQYFGGNHPKDSEDLFPEVGTVLLQPQL